MMSVLWSGDDCYRLTRHDLIRSVSAAKEPDRRGIVLEPGPIFIWASVLRLLR